MTNKFLLRTGGQPARGRQEAGPLMVPVTLFQYLAAFVVLFAGFILPALAGGQVEGTTMAWERITISSPVEEIVAEVIVEEGDKVAKGDVLAQLLVRKQELEVLRLEQLITKAKFSYEATRTLHEQKIESRETLMEKKSDLDGLILEREIALEMVEERRIVAPIAGTVVHRLKDPGESIGRVEPLFEIIDVSRLKLTFFLSTEHLPQLLPGMVCEIAFPEFPDQGTHEATLYFIDPQVDARSGLFRVRFEFDNAKARIKPGVRVRATLPDAKGT
jgi:membrane fusion protein (multidrug efflux system)